MVYQGITTQKFNENAKKMEKSNYEVWPAPSSKFLKVAHGLKSLASPAPHQSFEPLKNLGSIEDWSRNKWLPLMRSGR